MSSEYTFVTPPPTGPTIAERAAGGAIQGASEFGRALDRLAERIADAIEQQREQERIAREEQGRAHSAAAERSQERARAIRELGGGLARADVDGLEQEAIVHRISSALDRMPDGTESEGFRQRIEALAERGTEADSTRRLRHLIELESEVSDALRASASSRPTGRDRREELVLRVKNLEARLTEQPLSGLPEVRLAAERIGPALSRLAGSVRTGEAFVVQQLDLLERGLDDAVRQAIQAERLRADAREKLRADAIVLRATLLVLRDEAPSASLAEQAEQLLHRTQRELASATEERVPDLALLRDAVHTLRERCEAELEAAETRISTRTALREVFATLGDEYDIREIGAEGPEPSFVIALRRDFAAHYEILGDGSIRGRLVRTRSERHARPSGISDGEREKLEEDTCRVADRVVSALRAQGREVERERRKRVAELETLDTSTAGGLWSEEPIEAAQPAPRRLEREA